LSDSDRRESYNQSEWCTKRVWT